MGKALRRELGSRHWHGRAEGSPLAWVALGVLVGHDRADCIHHGLRDEVLSRTRKDGEWRRRVFATKVTHHNSERTSEGMSSSPRKSRFFSCSIMSKISGSTSSSRALRTAGHYRRDDNHRSMVDHNRSCGTRGKLCVFAAYESRRNTQYPTIQES